MEDNHLQVLDKVFREQARIRKKARDKFKTGMEVVDEKIPLTKDALEIIELVNNLEKLSAYKYMVQNPTDKEIKSILLEVGRLRYRLNRIAKNRKNG